MKPMVFLRIERRDMVKSFKKKLLIGAVAAMMSCSFAYGAEAASRAEVSS